MVLPLRDQNPITRLPIVTIILISVNVFVYLAVQPHGDTESNRFLYDHAVIPCEVVHSQPLSEKQVATGECSVAAGDIPVQTSAGVVNATDAPLAPGKNIYLAIIISMFLHANLVHLLGNMLFLWVFGNNIEDRLKPIGFTIFYFAAGIIATLAFTAVNASSVSPLVGASGAIAGVMGAYLIWFPRARILSIVFPVFFFPFYLPASIVLVVWFVLQFFTDPHNGVAWIAHVAGFLFGAAVAYAFRGTRGTIARAMPPPPPPPPGAWPGGYQWPE